MTYAVAVFVVGVFIPLAVAFVRLRAFLVGDER